ncbi:MAG TPA: hypothetical protein VN976_22065 [Verrucomicrobiae bacterium]|nr:hypothetical protein [Verrucomicrobiae bacterium]
MRDKLEQAIQGVFSKLNFAIEDEAKSHGILAHDLRVKLIDRLFNATDSELAGLIHSEADRGQAEASAG